MSDTQSTYHFVIDALTPESVPMARLAEYMADLADLFGHKEHVHFDRVARSFDGMLIRVGGKDDTVPVHLQAGDKIHICNADRDMARRLAPHLYQGTLRVWGDGCWEREPSGHWRLIRFDIGKFELLDDSPISEIVATLRKVEGSGWKQFDDPLAELMRLRR